MVSSNRNLALVDPPPAEREIIGFGHLTLMLFFGNTGSLEAL